MGRVTITEPSVGDSLTVTDINSTLTSFNTEASDVDGENVHDQSLDNFNFEADVGEPPLSSTLIPVLSLQSHFTPAVDSAFDLGDSNFK